MIAAERKPHRRGIGTKEIMRRKSEKGTGGTACRHKGRGEAAGHDNAPSHPTTRQSQADAGCMARKGARCRQGIRRERVHGGRGQHIPTGLPKASSA